MSKLYNTFVPDDGPLDSPLWLIGESPGTTEEEARKPFVGDSGQLLMDVLRNHGIQRSDVRLANLCKFRPFGNDFKNCLGTEQLSSSVALLHEQIRAAKPKCIITLGTYPTQFIADKYGIESWRGSIVSYKHDPSIKVVAARHPAAVLRDRKEYPIFDFDIRRGIEESKSRNFNYPEYEFSLNPTGHDRDLWEARICNSPSFVASDIENVKGTFQILCICFAVSPTQSVVFEWNDYNISVIQRILASNVVKAFHFGTHDTTVLEENGFYTNNYNHDTMALQHVINPEMPRSLSFLTSIHTRQPYYKAEGRKTIPNEGKGWKATTDKEKLFVYNGTDGCVTWDICNQLQNELLEYRSSQIDIYNYEIEMIQIARNISRTGLLIDPKRRALLKNTAVQRWRKRQGMFNFLVSYHDPEIGKDCNVSSPKKIPKLLYEVLGLPVKKKRDGKITTDEDAIVELLTYVKAEKEKVSRKDAVQRWTEKELILSEILNIRGIRKLIGTYLDNRLSTDGRLRASFKVCSTETARWACESYVDDTGTNAQTFPRNGLDIEDKDMLVEEEVKMSQDEINEIAESIKEEEESEVLN